MPEPVTADHQRGGVYCRIPVGAIDPDNIECLEDLDAEIAAYDAANLEYSNRVHVAEWEECAW